MIKFSPVTTPNGRELKCADCGYFPDAPQLTRDVWDDYIAKPAEDPRTLLLCCGCTEHRLHRHIQLSDLVYCPANGPLLNLHFRM